MADGYENVKLFYEEIRRTFEYTYKDIQEVDFAEYVSSVYDDVVGTKYAGHEKYAVHGLKTTSTKLKELILDAIFSNLYSDFLLMLQNLDENIYNLKHEIFLTTVECNKNLEIDVSQTCKERFRRRMQANRLNLINKVKIKCNDKTTFYSPSLIRAFKETLFIRRNNTDIFDISEIYADIFYSLMFDSDEEASLEFIKESKETIKSYRLWKLSDNDIYLILRIVQNIIENHNEGDQVAQMILLEKLFGLNTIAYLWENMDRFNEYNLFAISAMKRFGYCILHQYLIDIMASKKATAIEVRYIVERFLYPVCSDVLKKNTKNSFEII